LVLTAAAVFMRGRDGGCSRSMLCMTMNWKEKLTTRRRKAWPRQRRKKNRKRDSD
jgi:hypothetical protein